MQGSTDIGTYSSSCLTMKFQLLFLILLPVQGWYYFGGGDRWFANFWKGRANGEGRFYSKDGSIYFGNFQNGWRHGESLYVDANGLRYGMVQVNTALAFYIMKILSNIEASV
jgi:hypothetical protein